jgi:rubrerythrin
VEKKSIDYYRSAATESSDPKAKEVFNWLVGEEAGHLTILTAEHNYWTKSGYYYDNAEFSLEVM